MVEGRHLAASNVAGMPDVQQASRQAARRLKKASVALGICVRVRARSGFRIRKSKRTILKNEEPQRSTT